MKERSEKKNTHSSLSNSSGVTALFLLQRDTTVHPEGLPWTYSSGVTAASLPRPALVLTYCRPTSA